MIRLGKLVVGAVSCAAVLFLALPALAAGGDLDPSWGGTGFVVETFGTNSTAFGVVAWGNRVVVVGGATVDDPADFGIASYNQDGSLDTTFGGTGLVNTNFEGIDFATAVALQGDKLVVVGFTSPDGDVYDFAVARYDHDGSLDDSFDTDGKVTTDFGTNSDDGPDAVTIKGDRIVAAGATNAEGTEDFALARYNKNGSLDTSFDTDGKVITNFNGGFDSANGVKILENRIITAGYVCRTPDGFGDCRNGNQFDFGLAKYRSDGSLDTSFDMDGKVQTDFGSGNDYAHAVDLRGQQIVAVGEASNGTDQDFAAAEYNKYGVLDPAFAGDGTSTIDSGLGDDVAGGGLFQYDGKIVAGGYTAGLIDQFAAGRWTTDGTPDPSFGGGDGFITTPVLVDSFGYAMATGPDNRIVVAGESSADFLTYQLTTVRYLAN